MKKWVFRHLPEHNTLMITCRGTIDASETRELAAEALTEGTLLGVCKFMVDNREMTPIGTTEEFYEMPNTLREMGMGPLHRVALVVPAGNPGAAELRFFETASYNRHLDLRLFGGMDEALAWLGRDEGSSGKSPLP